MTQLISIRTRFIELYQKAGNVLKIMGRFVFSLIVLWACRNLTGYNSTVSNAAFVLLIAAISAFLPPVIALVITIIYVALQLYMVSLLMAATVIGVSIVLFCFFVRYIPKYSDAIRGMPVLCGIKLPFIIPISFGLFSTPITIVPTCIGVFAYYFLKGINKNIGTLEQVQNSDDPFELYTNILTDVVNNKAMISAMLTFSIAIVIVYIVRNLKMDYAYEIAAASGTAVCMLGMFIMMLRYDVGFGFLSLIFCSLFSGLISYIAIFMYRPLSYAAVENVQFEDDDYYYYVRAVPKLKYVGDKVEIKHVVGRTDEAAENVQPGPSAEHSSDDEISAAVSVNAGFRMAGLLTKISSLAAPPKKMHKKAVKATEDGKPHKRVKSYSDKPVRTAGRTNAVTNITEKAADKTANRPVRTAGKTAGKTAGRTNAVTNTTEKAADKTANRPVRTAGKTAGRTAGRTNAGTNITEKAADKTANRPAKSAKKDSNRPN